MTNLLLRGDTGEKERRFATTMADAWNASFDGSTDIARDLYEKSDAIDIGGEVNAGLSVLRHSRGEAKGKVVPIRATEDRVICFSLPSFTEESADAYDMRSPVIDADMIEVGLRKTIRCLKPGHHRDNITKRLPHVLFLSTGRCGTRSMEAMLKGPRPFTYHDYWWMVSVEMRWFQQCALMSGSFDPLGADQWCQTRAAEWLGAISHDEPMVGVNHTDTVFAGVFAALHPEARFVHLVRDPVATFDSFYMKDQWREYQLRPINYAFDPGFRWIRTGHSIPECIAWYFRMTEAIAEAMERIVGDRFIRVSSDLLFGGDREEMDRLGEFLGVRVDTLPHVNAKTHRFEVEEKDMPPVRQVFEDAYARVKETGRL